MSNTEEKLNTERFLPFPFIYFARLCRHKGMCEEQRDQYFRILEDTVFDEVKQYAKTHCLLLLPRVT